MAERDKGTRTLFVVLRMQIAGARVDERHAPSRSIE